MSNKDKISCPICGKEKTWHTDNPFKPFCSERCKLIDLGEWASDERRIPGKKIDHDDFPEDDSGQA